MQFRRDCIGMSQHDTGAGSGRPNSETFFFELAQRRLGIGIDRT